MELREIEYTLNCLGFRSPLRFWVLIKTDLWTSAVLAWVFWNVSCRRWVSDTATCQSMTSETWMMEENVSIAKLWSRASRALWLVQYYPLRSKHGKWKDNPHSFPDMFLKHPVAPVVDVLQQYMFFTQVMFWNSGRQGAAGSQCFQGFFQTTDWWTLIQWYSGLGSF